MIAIHDLDDRGIQGLSCVHNFNPHDYYSLVGLMDILGKYACRFVYICNGLRVIIDLQKAVGNDKKPVPLDYKLHYKAVFVKTDELCEEFGFRVSRATCQEALMNLDTVTWNRATEIVSKLAENLLYQINLECADEQFLHIDPHKTDLWENQFDAILRDIFPEAIYDMEEAGKCLALNRHTASTFHSLRVVESGIRFVKSHCGIEKHTPSWDAIINEIDSYVQKLSPKTHSPERNKLQAINIRIGAIKDAWRNPTMHVENKYNEQEAREILDAAKNFMKIIWKELINN